jgi:hypothetical protein
VPYSGITAASKQVYRLEQCTCWPDNRQQANHGGLLSGVEQHAKPRTKVLLNAALMMILMSNDVSIHVVWGDEMGQVHPMM